MFKVLLCCETGVSTALLVKKMKIEAEKRRIECQITAYPYDSFYDHVEQYDICLIAPQIKRHYHEIEQYCLQNHKACGLIHINNFGMLRGDLVLNNAIKVYNEYLNRHTGYLD
ncbi:PTS sugar transporter subunit IIB [Vibrio sp. SS-MA-C1-2]|uniref:PTS sugar transporter subunit IIB n=1 Tax=Vibrio sp. SS-MA-C1-2 TaxID=2908646 RepID=UPI001F37CD3C|nr:PTS sugar transporter subunit IIB [Vibrio sp. SS-MA-C1-2]UJF16829.1 PTS sugar transporter subunit IIB [Vibrio sp. SS-MA-C1-2]